jgi:DNA-directed RNA polymerase subunit beta
MLTIKSDDIAGRSAAFDAIVKGIRITQSGVPASFGVLLNTLRGLSLDVELKRGGERAAAIPRRTSYERRRERSQI